MKDPKIVMVDGFCGGRPVIEGTRIKVSQVALEFEHLQMSPDEIVQSHPHLTLSQVHAALSYYYQHIQDIKKEMKENKVFVDQMKKSFVSKVSKLEYA